MTKVQRLREVTVNLVRMDLRGTSGESLEIMENNNVVRREGEKEKGDLDEYEEEELILSELITS